MKNTNPPRATKKDEALINKGFQKLHSLNTKKVRQEQILTATTPAILKMTNAVEKKFLFENGKYSLVAYNGDTSKRWYVLFYDHIKNTISKRVKIYGGINRLSNPVQRFEAGKRLIDDLLTGRYYEDQSMGVIQAAFDSYFAERSQYLRNKTRVTYLTKINNLIDWISKTKIRKIKDLTHVDAKRFLKSLAGKNPTTINSYAENLRTVFEWLKVEKHTDLNPFFGIQKLPEARRGKMYFNEQQIELLKGVISVENPMLWFACQLEYYCFIRPAEIRLLKVEDIDIADMYIRVPASISKNKKTQVVSIPQSFVKDVIAFDITRLRQDYYLINKSDEPLQHQSLSKQHKTILKRLGFSDRYSLYSWKHTGAYMAVTRGKIGLKDLQMQMRHHSLDQLNEYLREMGVLQSEDIKKMFPAL